MISQADLEEFLGIAVDVDKDLIANIEVSAVEWFEKQTQRYFGAAVADTVILSGNGKRDLYLPEPITSVGSVVYQSYPGGAQTTITAGDDDGFEIRDMHLARKGGFAWSGGYEYVVTYTRGYAAGSEPADVRMAIKQIVAFWYHGGKPADGASQKTSETMGNYSYTRGALFTTPGAMLNGIPGLRETIASWKIPRF